MKAAAYVRVSTDIQAEEGFSISAQIKLLSEYCVENNLELFNIYIDEGISGGKEDRPQFQEMIKDAEKGLFQVILVHKFDRFARKVELSQKIKNRLKKSNINVVSITEPIEDSPIGFFQEGLLELLSEYFIRNLSKEVKKGLVERASQGKHTGFMPYGYYVEHGTVKINQEQATIVKKVFELYLTGWGYNKISKYLNENRVPIMLSPNKNKRGAWQHHQIYRMLQNVKYVGKIYYAGETYPAEWEPIIPLDIFEQAQNSKGIRGKKYTYRGSNFEKFYLLGVLRCGVCDAVMRVQDNSKSSSKRKNSKYTFVCNHACRYNGMCDHTKHYQVVKLTNTILETLRSILGSRKTILSVSGTKQIDIVSGRKEKVVHELKRAKQAYLAGIFELAEYGELKTRLEKELSELNSIKDNQDNNSENKQAELLLQLKNVLDAIEKTESISQKRNLILSIIKEIKITPTNIEIIYNL